MGIQQSNSSSHAGIVSSASSHHHHHHHHEEGIHYKDLLHINKIINNKQNNNYITTISIRANIIKYIDYEKLWNNFLDSTYSSFAITESELIYLLKQSIILNNNNKDDKIIMIDIMNYITLVDELTSSTFKSKTLSSSSSSSKLYDFISVCSSVLLLNNNNNIDIKSSQLFEWICMKVTTSLSSSLSRS
jgi:hypothetical protein